MRALILDGYHKGEAVTLGRRGSRPLDFIRLIKPATTTICDCNPDIEDRLDSPQRIIEYKLAAVSIADDFALYSEKGDLFEPMTKGRGWIVTDEYLLGEREPITVGCHEPKAFK